MTFDSTKFKRSLAYEGAQTPNQLEQTVDAIREIDRNSESSQRLWGMLSVVGFLASIGLFIVFIVSLENFPLAVTFGGGGATFTIFSIVMWQSSKRCNFVDERYELLGGVNQLLARDMATDATIQIHFDVGRPNSNQKYVSKGKAGHWNVKYYEDPWLTMSGQLLDGTKFQLLVIEKFQARGRWKTSASGKSKYKSKTKTGTVSTLRLKPKLRKITNWSNHVDASSDAIQLPDWVELKGLQEEGDILALKVGAKDDWSVPKAGEDHPRNGVNMVAMMFLSLYQILNLSKAVAKAQR
jgi:hypothetical protein